MGTIENPPKWIVQELVAHGFPVNIIDAVMELPPAADPILAVRTMLETFLRHLVLNSPSVAAVPFGGDPRSFRQLRKFASTQRWLTDTESVFVDSFYSLLSESVHGGTSLVAPVAAHETARYVLALLLQRSAADVSNDKVWRGSAHRLDLATEFVAGLRSGDHSGRAFQAQFDSDQMNLTRKVLLPSDVPLLLEVISDTSRDAQIRNRCASVLLSPACFPGGEGMASAMRRLKELYRETVAALPRDWQVPRGIALALSNRANDSECILHFVSAIRSDGDLLSKNLAQTERYYRGRQYAVKYYLDRIRREDIAPEACIWEVFYLTECADTQQRPVVARALRRLDMRIDDAAMRAFWRGCLSSLA